MPRITRSATTLLIVVTGLLVSAAVNARDTTSVLRDLVGAPFHPDLAWSDLDDVRPELTKVYEATAYSPVWLSDGQPTAQAQAVVAYLQSSDTRGLRPGDYDAAYLATQLERLSASGGGDEAGGRFDTALTVALLRLLRHTESGRVAPRRFSFGVEVAHEADELQPVLLGIAGSHDVAREIDSMQPVFSLFERLLTTLAKYRGLAARSELPEIPEIPTLHPGESSPASAPLRAHLLALGDLEPGVAQAEDVSVYDEPLTEAVKRFQRRHGLDVDGVVGRATLRALRVPLAERVTQIQLAIERLRWLPRRTSDRFLIVNIPEFRLVAFERGNPRPLMASNVVVGSAARRHETPILTAEMQYIVFRPYWNIPRRILHNEILPKVSADPAYLDRNDMERIDGRIRQRPGPNNSLGLVKFIFPNPSHVYLHDTPAKALFGRARRDFSHGCIRVQQAIELAEFVLRDWTREEIVAAMEYGTNNRHVHLAEPVDVYLLYSTVIVSAEGEVRFFEDIYGHDAELQQALAKGAPYP